MAIYDWLQVKRKLEEILMMPFVAYGKWKARRQPLKATYDLFCFFSKYELGGAEKVHADIIQCFPDKKIMIFFTRRSGNEKMLHLFAMKNVEIRDISGKTDNKWRYWDNLVWRGICAYYINHQPVKPVVFSGQCNFGYKVFPHIRKDILKAELIHVAEKKFSWITFPYIGVMDKRVMISATIIGRAKEFYRQIGVPDTYAGRIYKIINKTDIPDTLPVREYREPVKIFYAGRGGYPKRIYLIAEIARQCHRLELPVKFYFAGNFEDELPGDIRPYTVYLGQKEGGREMMALHQEMDVLLMTSASEAFPMVIMEAMANGVVVITTAVGGIPEHITHGENGFLIKAEEEKEIIRQGIEQIRSLCNDTTLLRTISRNGRTYAEQNFSTAVFCQAYTKLLFGGL